MCSKRAIGTVATPMGTASFVTISPGSIVRRAILWPGVRGTATVHGSPPTSTTEPAFTSRVTT